MLTTLLSWLTGKVAGPVATFCAVIFAIAALWQTARIEGVFGGGLKVQVATLQAQLAARDLAAAKAQSRALIAREQRAEKSEREAASHAAEQIRTQTQIETIVQKVPVYVSAKSDQDCRLPWGFVRLFDAAAGGGDLDTVRAAIAPGQPDDAASDVSLSEALAVLSANFGAARQNADQLEHLEKAVAADH
ncbi:MAG: hypothetical protein JO256_01150 [Alphaproteobacteria bacterium]|nr:hypothetical protein [Alphaproteobacteria bacterium]